MRLSKYFINLVHVGNQYTIHCMEKIRSGQFQNKDILKKY